MPPFFDLPSSSVPGSWPAYAQLRVHLADADGRPLPRSLVALRKATGHAGPDLPCRFDARANCYIGPSVVPGDYLLIAQARGFVAQRRRVTLGSGVSETAMLLGTARAITLSRGDAMVPLREELPPRVAVQLDVPSEEAARLVLETARTLRLEVRPLARELVRAGVLVFDLPVGHHAGTTPVVQQDRLRSVLAQLAATRGVRHAGR